MKAYLSFLSPGNISYGVASYGTRIFIFGLVLTTIAGVFIFIFLGWKTTKGIPKAGIKLDTVNEVRLQQALEVLNFDSGGVNISPRSPFD